jgi:hypothetical protein
MIYYRIAYHTGSEWRFTVAAYTALTSVRILIQGNLVERTALVFGATNFELLDEQLARYNQGMAAVCLPASQLMAGKPFHQGDIEKMTRMIQEEELGHDLAFLRHLEFVRGMVQTGKLHEGIPDALQVNSKVI